MSQQFQNNPTALVVTLTSNVTSGATTIPVSDVSIFPASGDFVVCCEQEYMLATGVSGLNLTVVRGQEGSTAAGHASGKAVTHEITKGVLDAFAQNSDNLSGLTSDSTARTNLGLGDAATHPASDFLTSDLDTLTAKTTPVDTDETVIADSAASFAAVKLTWANLKATLKTYFDTLYSALATYIRADGSVAFTGDQSMGGHKLTSLGTPSASTDAATKAYVDVVAQGLSVKYSVKGASTANHSVSAFSGTTIDGGSVSLTTGDRILLKNQSTASQNGIWIYQGSGSALTRPTDFATGANEAGAFTFVESGTANGGSGWVLAATSCVVDTDSETWTQFSGGGTYTAGAGLSLSGSTFSANPDGTTLDTSGTGSSLEVKAGGIGTTQLANSGVTLAKIANIADKTLLGNSSGGAAAPTAETAPTVSGEMTASDFKAAGLTGAVAASRYVGATSSGAPASGTFAVGDFVIDQTGVVWVCISAGTPGTWFPIGPLLLENHQTGTSYTLALTDFGYLINCDNSSAFTLTIPANASVAFPVGTQIDIYNGGSGQVTVAITSDTLHAPNGAKLAHQYSRGTLWKQASTVWVISGDTTT